MAKASLLEAAHHAAWGARVRLCQMVGWRGESTHSLFVALTSASDSGLQSSGQSCLLLHSTAALCSLSQRNTMCLAIAYSSWEYGTRAIATDSAEGSLTNKLLRRGTSGWWADLHRKCG